jgi:predicted ester cyclase
MTDDETTSELAIRNKAIVRHGVEQVFNLKKLDFIDELYCVDVIDHSAPPGLPAGIEGARLKLAAFTGAFPDLQLTYEHLVAEGDMVAGRFVLSGTHRGEFAGVEPTGNPVRVTGHDLMRIRDGKVSEHWVVMDSLSLMQQLGVVQTD